MCAQRLRQNGQHLGWHGAVAGGIAELREGVEPAQPGGGIAARGRGRWEWARWGCDLPVSPEQSLEQLFPAQAQGRQPQQALRSVRGMLVPENRQPLPRQFGRRGGERVRHPRLWRNQGRNQRRQGGLVTGGGQPLESRGAGLKLADQVPPGFRSQLQQPADLAANERAIPPLRPPGQAAAEGEHAQQLQQRTGRQIRGPALQLAGQDLPQGGLQPGEESIIEAREGQTAQIHLHRLEAIAAIRRAELREHPLQQILQARIPEAGYPLHQRAGLLLFGEAELDRHRADAVAGGRHHRSSTRTSTGRRRSPPPCDRITSVKAVVRLRGSVEKVSSLPSPAWGAPTGVRSSSRP